MTIELPISKSIANRLLILQAMHGDPLLEVSAATAPDDVLLLHRILQTKQETPPPSGGRGVSVRNCGTAMRFLTAYYACQEGAYVVLDGCERMRHRPIGQLVDALLNLGADIRYLGEEGYPPLEIHGRTLDHSQRVYLHRPVSTQFVSALLLCGFEVETDIVSPYIELTRKMVADYPHCSETNIPLLGGGLGVSRDWSAAAFWLERYTLGLCEEPVFPSLREDSMQGDRVARDIFQMIRTRTLHALDCSAIPDLVPAIAVACHELGMPVQLTGTESLRIKESDRLDALEQNFRLIDAAKGLPYEPVLHSYGDHRIAMAFLAAGYKVDDIRCIDKSYPQFYEQLCSTSR